MTYEQKIFAEKNINLMYHYFHKNNIDDEDDRADLMEYYCYCITKYDESMGKFSTLLYLSLDRYRKRLYNYNHRLCRHTNDIVSLDIESDSDFDWHEKLPSNDEDFEDVELSDVCSNVMERLVKKQTSRSKKIEDFELFSMLLDGYTRKEICEKYNLSPAIVSMRIKKLRPVWDKEMEEC